MSEVAYAVVVTESNITELAVLVLGPEVGEGSTKTNEGGLSRVVGSAEVDLLEGLQHENSCQTEIT